MNASTQNKYAESDTSASIPKSRFWRSHWFQNWLSRKVPPKNTLTLTHKNIFILPTKQGLSFLLLILFMVLAGINYQNSLIFALAFLLVSLFMVSILHTFRNLSGLTVHGGHTQPAFVGEDAAFEVRITRQGKRHFEALVVGWQAEFMLGADLVDDVFDISLKLYVPAKQRGYLNPGRLLIQTYYPVGLFRAWSWVDLNLKTLVYPSPIAGSTLSDAVVDSNEGAIVKREGTDDFYGMRAYQQGDSLKHVAWKSYARTGDMLLKEFASYVDRRIWLDWHQFSNVDSEIRLGYICDWILRLSKTTDTYGLRLPGLEVAPDNSLEHRNRLLSALALFDPPRHEVNKI